MIGIIPYIISIPYVGIITFFSIGLYKKKYVLKNKTNLPTFSLIISCRNEEINLPSLLMSIDKQILKADEIIFIDDNSTDKTFYILNEYAKEKNNIKVFKSKYQGKKAALIQAAQIAENDYLMFTDADCVLNENHILLAADFLAENNSDMLLGGVDIKDKNIFFNILEKIEFASLQASTAGSTLMRHPFICNGANLVIKRSVYLDNTENINLDIASGDDVFMLHSIKEQNKKIDYLYNENYIVKTAGTDSLSSFLKQRIRWASKSASYKDLFTIFTETIIALTNIMVLISYLFSPIMYIIKLIIDSSLLIPYFIKYRQKKILYLYIFIFPIMSFLYPLYVWIVGFSSFAFTNSKQKNWK